MSSTVVAAGTSSAAYSRGRSVNRATPSVPQCQKTSFQGVSLQDSRRGISNLLLAERGAISLSVTKGRRDLVITARTAAKNIEVEVDKPLGLTLGQKSGGGVIITAVENGGNAAKAGLKAGDQVLYTSSFFGDELWPADKLGFTKTAIQAVPESCYFVVSRGADVDVKRLPKRPAPPRFGRKLTDAQKASLVLHLKALIIEMNLPYLFSDTRSWLSSCSLQPDGYVCPQCRAPKKRFLPYDVNTGKAVGGGLPPIGVIIGLLVGIGGVGALLVYGLQ
nr:electron transporter, putative [Ipomoea batatas]